MKKYYKYSLIIIILLAAFFRLYGLNWDQNQHLHPDERFLTMVTQDAEWPVSISEYFSKDNPLSPYNNGYDFFVYGMFPMVMVKFISGIITFDPFDYNNITLVGRMISALMDIGVVLLLYKIGKYLYSKKVGLIAALLYSIFVLPIQLSHFYTADTFLVFFLICSFYLSLKVIKGRHTYIYVLITGASYGMALASKLSALYFLPVILSVFFILVLNKKFIRALIYLTVFSFTSFLTWRILDPKTFLSESLLELNPQFIENIVQLQNFNEPSGWFPPAVQWINTTSIIFPLKNMLLWGLGIPVSILLILSMIYIIYYLMVFFMKKVKGDGIKSISKISLEKYLLTMILIWTVSFFVYQGSQFVKAMRYFYILYPFFALLISVAYHYLPNAYKKANNHINAIIVFVLLLFPLSFVSIYSKEHTRVSASKWIYNNIPQTSTITCEHWDDCLPLPLGQYNHTRYKTLTLELFYPDTTEKWNKINSQLATADYLILSSNRLSDSITNVPEKYPIASEFYNELFRGRTDFQKVKEFTSRPTIPLLNIELIDDNADESFTVYDHPKVIIFEKK